MEMREEGGRQEDPRGDGERQRPTKAETLERQETRGNTEMAKEEGRERPRAETESWTSPGHGQRVRRRESGTRRDRQARQDRDHGGVWRHR